MASYHFSIKIGSRGAGQSAVRSAAYRSAEILVDERLGEICDFSRKEKVAYTEILLPEGAPTWMADREALWNRIEKKELRKDAQLFREFELALPRELNLEQNIELLRDFIKRECTARGMVSDMCIHWKDGNPHAHVLNTLRGIEDGQFSNKMREWNDSKLSSHWRKEWAVEQNRYLEMHGHEARVSHLSLAAQGIQREPEIHHGNKSGLRKQVAAIRARNFARAKMTAQAREILSKGYARQAQAAQRKILADRQREQDIASVDMIMARMTPEQYVANEVARELAAAEARLATAQARLAEGQAKTKGLFGWLYEVNPKVLAEVDQAKEKVATWSRVNLYGNDPRVGLFRRKHADNLAKAVSLKLVEDPRVVQERQRRQREQLELQRELERQRTREAAKAQGKGVTLKRGREM